MIPFLNIIANITVLGAIYKDLNECLTKDYDGYIYHNLKSKCSLFELIFALLAIIISWTCNSMTN